MLAISHFKWIWWQLKHFSRLQLGSGRDSPNSVSTSMAPTCRRTVNSNWNKLYKEIVLILGICLHSIDWNQRRVLANRCVVLYVYIYISINNYLDFWSRTNSNTFICKSEFHISYEAIIWPLTTVTVKLHFMIYK